MVEWYVVYVRSFLLLLLPRALFVLVLGPWSFILTLKERAEYIDSDYFDGISLSYLFGINLINYEIDTKLI